MYLRFYGFHDYPFAVTPDPAFLYLSPQHKEALGHLLYGIGEHGGFVALTGEVGTGKTTLIRALLDHDDPDLDVALCLNPKLTVTEFVAEICDELGAPRRKRAPTLKTLVDALNSHLLETHAAGRRTVLIVDEAQNLSRDVLEQLRLLTNLETRKHKLMRIILVGQPELEALLQREDLRQLAQRITARSRLRPLGRADTPVYIGHRLEVAGGAPTLFTARACRAAHAASAGVPRLINTVCERALMGGYAQGARQITAAMVRRAAREALPADVAGGALARRLALPAAMVAGAVVLAFGLHYGAQRWGGSAIGLPLAPALPARAAAQELPVNALEAANANANANGPSAPAAPAEGAGASAVAAKSQAAPEPSAGSAAAAAGATPAATPVAALASEPANPAQAQSENLDDGGRGAELAAGAAQEPPLPPFPKGDVKLAQLLRLWGVFGAAGQVRCDSMQIGDLRCLRARGEMVDLLRFDLPALLTLREGDATAQVILSSLTPNTATLVVAEGAREWPRAVLAARWTGEYRLVWRLQAPVRRVLQGSIGDGVVWLRQRLALAAGVNPDNRAGKPSRIFDAGLKAAVQRFQAAHGLKPDGVVGARTMILLNHVTPTPGTPQLITAEPAD